MSFMFWFLVILPTTLLAAQVTQNELETIIELTVHRKLTQHDKNMTIQTLGDLKSRISNHAAEELTCEQLKNLYPSIFISNQTIELCAQYVDTSCSNSALQNLSVNTQSTIEAVKSLCPLLLLEPACKDGITNPGKIKPVQIEVWGWAILSVTIISCTSLVGVIIVPFLNQKSYMNVINLFEGLAVGSLTGSAIFHLIPQSFNLLTSDSKHDFLWKALVIFGGIYMFYWSERIMNIIVQVKESKDVPKVSNLEMNGRKNEPETNVQLLNASTISPEDQTLEQRIRTTSESIVERSGDHHGHHHHPQKGQKIATVAWMIIFGDGLHNFIDGLSIGAAFSENILTGVSICLAVVCEEFPHELGDFAVLIASGMSIKQAVGYNFLSACTCYLGMIVGILLGDQGPTYIFALAGGMFLYIALVDMMGELTAEVEKASKVSVAATLNVLLLQNIGILIGIATLFLLAKYSELISLG